jgi:hypothetical protein
MSPERFVKGESERTSLIFLPFNLWCLCWWLVRKAANENAALMALSIYLRSPCLCGF